MLAWLSENVVTIIVIAVLLLLVGAAVFVLVRDKKNDKGGCTGNCASCSGCCCRK